MKTEIYYQRNDYTDYIVNCFFEFYDLIKKDPKYYSDYLSPIAQYLNYVGNMLHTSYSVKDNKDNSIRIMNLFKNSKYEDYFYTKISKLSSLYKTNYEYRLKKAKNRDIDSIVDTSIQDYVLSIPLLIIDNDSIKYINTPCSFSLNSEINKERVFFDIKHLKIFYEIIIKNKIVELPIILMEFYNCDPLNSKNKSDLYLHQQGIKRSSFSLYIFISMKNSLDC